MSDQHGKILLQEFISAFQGLPELWDVRSENYMKKSKKLLAYEKLLEVYKSLKADATVEDAKKKINTLRSNFRKELKKIHDSKASGAGTDDIYQPSSWVFYELLFLKDLEKPVQTRNSIETTVELLDDNLSDDGQISGANIDDMPQRKKRKIKYKSDDLLNLACNYLQKDDSSEVNTAQVWGSKLRNLPQDQKLLAEKYINDILFEAEMGTLTRNSVKINECRNVDILPASRPMSAASTSTSHDDGDSMNHSTIQMEPLTQYCICTSMSSNHKNILIM
ncbi:Small ubiquitin-related modifier 2 [Halocaridina rubra]|uniref:Small ubiquitin-related modifier 2 n=1 Tax=Halocaridina rubra TaxID=373956 RepID=A0AAN8WBE4_HALRR